MQTRVVKQLASLSGILITVVVTGLLYWETRRDLGREVSLSEADGTGISQKGRRGQLIGNDACRECHAEIYSHYKRNPMSQSWQILDRSLKEHVNLPARVNDAEELYEYQVEFHDRELEFTESIADGSIANELMRPAHFIVGSGNHARSFLTNQNGYLTQLPLAWFSRQAAWKLSPGYELTNHRFDRPVLPGCLSCHGGEADHHSATRNHYQNISTAGISCEHCHGPGQHHRDLHQTVQSDLVAKQEESIVNPVRISSPLANDICLKCHLQGDVTLYRETANPFSFQPGHKLADHRFDFLIDNGDVQSFGVASHGARMLASRCYQESQEQLTCFSCHDPHRPTADFSIDHYDARCATCHSDDSCKRQPTAISDTDSCVRCHMPQRATREGQHLVFTDHLISVRSSRNASPAQRLMLAPNANPKLVPAINLGDELEESLGMAYIKLHLTMGPQYPSLSRGITLLSQSIGVNRNRKNYQARYWLATAYVAQKRSDEAIAILNNLLRERPDDVKARFRLAIAYQQNADLVRAIDEHERVIREAPQWMAPYPIAVRLHLSQGNTDQAIRLLDQQRDYLADETTYLNLALAYHLKGQQLSECLEFVDLSLRLNPVNPVAYSTRAYLYSQSGQKAAARRDYEQALQIDPENVEAQNGLNSLKVIDSIPKTR